MAQGQFSMHPLSTACDRLFNSCPAQDEAANNASAGLNRANRLNSDKITDCMKERKTHTDFGQIILRYHFTSIFQPRIDDSRIFFLIVICIVIFTSESHFN